ncbi:hypothetical protein HBB16_19905 [Pseudonocardia sp. MCCB 268]|nr:hypothetical protein [Pseudonocardia cytotoxica]
MSCIAGEYWPGRGFVLIDRTGGGERHGPALVGAFVLIDGVGCGERRFGPMGHDRADRVGPVAARCAVRLSERRDGADRPQVGL